MAVQKIASQNQTLLPINIKQLYEYSKQGKKFTRIFFIFYLYANFIPYFQYLVFIVFCGLLFKFLPLVINHAFDVISFSSHLRYLQFSFGRNKWRKCFLGCVFDKKKRWNCRHKTLNSGMKMNCHRIKRRN